MDIRAIDSELEDMVKAFFIAHWGAPIMVSRGKVHQVDKLPGYVAIGENGKLQGLITYSVVDDECEVVSLDSIYESRGIGSGLLEAVMNCAKERGCKRVWLVTTNDNVRAMSFYQKKGFNMVALYINAVTKARELKPEIPLLGYDGIAIKHEIELEVRMDTNSVGLHSHR